MSGKLGTAKEVKFDPRPAAKWLLEELNVFVRLLQEVTQGTYIDTKRKSCKAKEAGTYSQMLT